MTEVTLVAPFGADFGPISHGTVAYRPYFADPKDPQSKLLVDTPPHVASHLTHNAGFYPMPQESEPHFTGTARLYAPHGCSWGGVQYTPDADDIVVVPSAAVVDLLAFPPICPETSRPEREPLPGHVSHGHDETAEIGRRMKEQGRAEMLGELDARDRRIADLEAQLHAATQPAADALAKVEAKVKPAKP